MKLKHLVLASILLFASACFAQSCKSCGNDLCGNGPPTKGELKHQTWLNSASLGDDLAPYSRTMSILIRGEQKDLKKEWCTQLRRGTFPVEGGDYVNWEMFLLKEGVHYRIKEMNETLDIAKGLWVFSHDDGIPAAVGTVR